MRLGATAIAENDAFNGHMIEPLDNATCRSMKRGLRVQVLRFGAVGVIGFFVNAGLVEALAGLINPLWAEAVAFPVAATTTWWLNRRYTFGTSGDDWHVEWLRYIGANAGGWLANNAVYFALILSFSLLYVHPSLAVAAGSLAGMVLNFTASKWFVFK